MTARAASTARTGREILDATAALWRERPIHELTLEAVAARAGVTVRTILRRHGSKEGLLEACIENDAGDTAALRDGAPVGDVAASLQLLVDDYERIGDAAIRTLAVEHQLPWAHRLLESGRRYHREWCARVFAPYLPEPADPDHQPMLLALIAATELYLWKLLRRDLGHTEAETRAVFDRLVRGVLSLPPV